MPLRLYLTLLFYWGTSLLNMLMIQISAGFVHAKPAATLLDVRVVSIRWEREGILPEAMPPEMAEVKDMLKKQVQLNQLSEQLPQLQKPHRWSQPPSHGPAIWRWCQKPGHFTHNCDNERVPHVQQSHPRQNSASQNQLSENEWPLFCRATIQERALAIQVIMV